MNAIVCLSVALGEIDGGTVLLSYGLMRDAE